VASGGRYQMSDMRGALAQYVALRRGFCTQLRESARALDCLVEFVACEESEFMGWELALR
jgi:hypothetical protein